MVIRKKPKRLSTTGRDKLPPYSPSGKQISAYKLLINGYDIAGNPEVHCGYDTLAGYHRPLGSPVQSNFDQQKDILRNLCRAFLELDKDSNFEWGTQTKLLSTTEGTAPNFDYSKMRREAQSHRGAHVDQIGVIRTFPIPSDTLIGSFSIAAVVTSIFFGPNAKRKVNTVESKRRKRSSGHGKIEWFETYDESDVRKAFRRLLAPDLNGSRVLKEQTDFTIPESWNDNKASLERTLMMMMVQSLTPTKQQLIGVGAGKPMLAGVLGAAEHNLKIRCAAEPAAIHRDGVVHFWIDELRRLGLHHLTVPLIKIR